jgi:hypothetical protein
LAGPGVVPSAKKCRYRRSSGAARSSARRTTPERHDDTASVGAAKKISRIIHGLTVMSTRTVKVRQATALIVSISARSMWSSW